MALKQRVTAGESDPDPVSVHRILVRDHGERDHLPVAIASVLASETAVETAIVIEIVNVTGKFNFHCLEDRQGVFQCVDNW